MDHRLAPPLETQAWFNTDRPITLDERRGRVIMLHAFQMLCPGCVARGIPQAKRVAERFADAPVDVIGIHTVFEHHDAMRNPSLEAFLHEYAVRFPVAVDMPGPDGDPIPRTMRAYQMRGTPTTVLIDATGRVRHQTFGAHDDLVLGAQLARLIVEAEDIPVVRADDDLSVPSGCHDGQCEVRSNL